MGEPVKESTNTKTGNTTAIKTYINQKHIGGVKANLKPVCAHFKLSGISAKSFHLPCSTKPP